jgi:signal transduction histidine kinase
VGLGLTIVKGIVEAHGGQVSVVSAPGAGSAFSFTLSAAGPA